METQPAGHPARLIQMPSLRLPHHHVGGDQPFVDQVQLDLTGIPVTDPILLHRLEALVSKAVDECEVGEVALRKRKVPERAGIGHRPRLDGRAIPHVDARRADPEIRTKQGVDRT